MNEERINLNFDINAKCQSMIEEANKIIKVYLETTNLYEEDGRYNLAYDVKNYLPKLQQENQRLKENYKSIDKSMAELMEEKQQLKEQLSNNRLVKTCENCEWFGVCPHSYKEYDYKNIIDELEKWLEEKLKEMQFIIDDVDIAFEVDYERISEAKNYKVAYNTALNELQKLKGSENNG